MPKKYIYLPPLIQKSYIGYSMYLPGAIGKPVRIEVKQDKAVKNA